MKIEVEIGREWQAGVNVFNATAFKNIKALARPVQSASGVPNAGKIKALEIPDCCIFRQALFIAACSHTFHYKRIRPILEAHHPTLSCPLCRTYTDLEDVKVDEGSWEIDVSEKDRDGRDGKHPTPVSSGAEGNGDNNGPGITSGGEGDDDRMDVDQNPAVRPEVVLEEPEPDEGEPHTGECS
ncbi:hypothetical protein P691DRAFT_765316 [Macrolepiota fuliginosa MF-IS2]|uniref:RING-type domain-containing protein n=1 Tax=Macrolepiota fuliginosa MF-IS2 TaxID=1400762 RepID=A0A9P5X2C1_9AGAR|nr:hypothetical protein P691DRAFT_765316 [Macrolepiota fuliginosa MF-IS2]